jgi:hypothetical protein
MVIQDNSRTQTSDDSNKWRHSVTTPLTSAPLQTSRRHDACHTCLSTQNTRRRCLLHRTKKETQHFMPFHIYISFTCASSRIAIRLLRKHSKEIHTAPPPHQPLLLHERKFSRKYRMFIMWRRVGPPEALNWYRNNRFYNDVCRIINQTHRVTFVFVRLCGLGTVTL